MFRKDSAKEQNRILNEKQEEVKKIKEGIFICLHKVYTPKSVEDAEKQKKFLQEIYEKVNTW